MAFDGAVLNSSDETARRNRQRQFLQVGEIKIADFLRNVDEEREMVMRKKYLEADLAEAQRFGNFKSYILFISEEFERDLHIEINQINNVINALEADDPEQHAEMIEELRDARDDLRGRKKRQKDFRNDVSNITDPKDWRDLETAFADLQSEMLAARQINQNWRSQYRNYWTNPGAYFAHRAKAKEAAMPAAAAAPELKDKNGNPVKHPKAEAWNAQLKKVLRGKLIGVSKINDPHQQEREFTFLHDMFGEKLVDEGLRTLYNEKGEQKFETMRQNFAQIVTKIHSQNNPNPGSP